MELYVRQPDNTTDEMLEVANLQTLFGKDYYVILRPSLSFKISNIDNKNHTALIISLIVIIIIVGCGLYIFLKYTKMKKNGKEFNFTNLKQELL